MTLFEENLRHRRWILLRYLQDRVAIQDWHGVMDAAAADLREVEAKLELVGTLYSATNEGETMVKNVKKTAKKATNAKRITTKATAGRVGKAPARKTKKG